MNYWVFQLSVSALVVAPSLQPDICWLPPMPQCFPFLVGAGRVGRVAGCGGGGGAVTARAGAGGPHGVAGAWLRCH